MQAVSIYSQRAVRLMKSTYNQLVEYPVHEGLKN